VPRFNKPNIKAGLENVVSNGASVALSRVTFRSNGVRYEAHWSMRLNNSRGERLRNPKEEVRLKNIDTENIIAEKKSDVKSRIEEVTKLNYHQFLRSVMLAQGEFTAFMLADKKDKVTLLEQITGVDIYKKVGEVISEKKQNEKRKLEEIKAKIIIEDLLSDDDVLELEKRKKDKEIQKESIDSEIKKYNEYIVWFEQKEEIEKRKQTLVDDRQILDKFTNDNKKIIDLLEIHKKANPYFFKIKEVNGIKLNVSKKTDRLKELSVDKIDVLKLIKEKKGVATEVLNKYKFAEKEQKEWEPKLDKVLQIDAEKERITIYGKPLREELGVLIKDIEQLNRDKEDKNQTLKTLAGDLETVGEYLHKNKDIIEIEKHKTEWNTELTKRDSLLEKIRELNLHIEKEKKQLSENSELLHTKKVIVEKDNAELAMLTKEVSTISEELSMLNLKELIEEKDRFEKESDELEKLHILSLDFIADKKTQKESEKKEEELSIKLSENQNSLKNIQTEIQIVDERLFDAESILGLEQKILSLEQERKNLKEGEPCALCGSTTHPFVEKYNKIELSKTEKTVKERKNELDNLKSKEIELSNNIATIKKELELLRNSILDLVDKNKKRTDSFANINSVLSIVDEVAIVERKSNNKEKSKQNSIKINKIGKLQTTKNEKEELLNKKRSGIQTVNNDIIKIAEKLKGIKVSISEKETDLQNSRELLLKNEVNLNKSLSVFDIKLVDIEDSKAFVKEIEQKVTLFKEKQTKQEELNNTIYKLNIDIKNIDKELEEKSRESDTKNTQLETLREELKTKNSERTAILPSEISPMNKREELQKKIEEAKKKNEDIKNDINKLERRELKIKTEIGALGDEVKELEGEIELKITEINKSLQDTQFDTIEQVERSVLSKEDESRYIGIVDGIKKKDIELNTLDNQIKEEELSHNKKKPTKSKEEIFLHKNEKETSLEELRKELDDISKKMYNDANLKSRNKSVIEQMELQEKQLSKWSDLLELLGGSKDAFNIFVQRLTLSNLIQLANIHLYKLNKRYSLKMSDKYAKGEELNFNLIDHYQTDNIRMIETSSGGEKFLISLALALGLSDLASNNVNIESLFIDEGFGSLDNSTLETVISTLETLQTQGKTIGVISHVESLKERISTQIQVVKKSSGISEVEIV
jgi:exonuclease SbcC